MDLEQKKTLICQFLSRCNRYADDELARYGAALNTAATDDRPALADKIAQWTAYRAFNEHAIAELKTDRLDDWFDDFETS
jgi:hypothetical protein